jgi:uncharacterized protein
MLYAIIGEDRAGTLEQRMNARPAHVERCLPCNRKAA